MAVAASGPNAKILQFDWFGLFLHLPQLAALVPIRN